MKKSIEKKKAVEFIKTSRQNGLSDKEIFNELSSRYFSEKDIIMLINSTLKPELKEKYKWHNRALIAIIILFVILNTTFTIVFWDDKHVIFDVAGLVTVNFLNLFLLFGIMDYKVSYYKFIGFIGGYSLISVLLDSYDNIDNLYIALALLPVLVLSYLLDKKLYPRYSEAKFPKDENGEYIFG